VCKAFLAGSKEMEISGPMFCSPDVTFFQRYDWLVVDHSSYGTDFAPTDFHHDTEGKRKIRTGF
jgi:hypothetical protein